MIFYRGLHLFVFLVCIHSCILCCRNGMLYTLNGQCQDQRWPELQKDLTTAAESFRVFAPKRSIPGWGSQP